MAWLNYHHLYYFYVTAREGGVAKAARKLKLGQPTVSTQLRRLEESLGRSLFLRDGRQLQLTDAGHMVLEYAERIFQTGSELQEALDDRKSPGLVHVQIGVLDSVPKHWVHGLMESAFEAGPCFVSVLEGPTDFLLRELTAHRIDLALTNNAPSPGPEARFRSRVVGSFPIAICGSPAFLRLRRGFPKSLDEQPFVLPTAHSKLRIDMEHFFETRGVYPRVIAETQDTALQKLLIQSGRALGALPRPAIKKAGLKEIGLVPHVGEQLWLSSASRVVKNPIAARLFQDFKI